MTDPLDALRDPVPDETPDPAFAAELRLRLRAELNRPLSPDRAPPRPISEPNWLGPEALPIPEPGRLGPEASPIPEPGRPDLEELAAAEIERLMEQPLTDMLQFALEAEEESMTTRTRSPIQIDRFSPYLAVADGQGAIEFYVEAFGAELVDDPVIMPDGKLGHATLQIGPLRLFLAEEFPEMGLIAPPRAGGVSVTLHLSLVSNDEVDAAAQRAVAAGARVERETTAGPYGYAGVIVDPAGHRWFLMSEPR